MVVDRILPPFVQVLLSLSLFGFFCPLCLPPSPLSAPSFLSTHPLPFQGYGFVHCQELGADALVVNSELGGFTVNQAKIVGGGRRWRQRHSKVGPTS